jgi:hypothetical protein
VKVAILVLLLSSHAIAEVSWNIPGWGPVTYPSIEIEDLCRTAIELGWAADDMGSIDKSESDRLFDESLILSERAAKLASSSDEEYCF